MSFPEFELQLPFKNQTKRIGRKSYLFIIDAVLERTTIILANNHFELLYSNAPYVQVGKVAGFQSYVLLISAVTKGNENFLVSKILRGRRC